ncbi:MAG: hypothetical protein ACRD9R_11895 [Pyrinomonadaceae bacterium]
MIESRKQAKVTPGCPACGASARRDSARFCSTCGRRLEDSAYEPADSLLSSYHRQRLGAPHDMTLSENQSIKSERLNAVATPRRRRALAVWLLGPRNESAGGAAAATAAAFIAYGLVPYLGILFCPGALVFAGVALARTHGPAGRWQARHAKRAAVRRLLLALVVLGVQLFLWWILYKVPEWAKT